MTKEERIKELINKYNEWDKKDDNTRDWTSCRARDNKRKISQRFLKEIHEPIENFLKKEVKQCTIIYLKIWKRAKNSL